MLAACSSRPASPPPVAPDQRDECRLSGDSAASLDTFTVALTDPVDWARVSTPTNDSERLLFRQLFETLVRVDCRGEIRQGIADGWNSDSTGRIWTFTLPEPGQFTDHPPITAGTVASSWKARGPGVQALGIDSAVALDDRTLRVTLRASRDSAPRLFADPLLSVDHRVAAVHDPSGRVVVPNNPPVDFELSSAGDPRDALDRGVDLVVTRDPAVTEYVASRPEFVTFPLPWSRTYALLQFAGTQPISGIPGADSLRRSLASDVVQAEARPAQPPFWWSGPQSCRRDVLMGVTLPTSPRLVYSRTDETARALAERIVALSGNTQLRAAGLGEIDFAAALRDRRERGYIVFLPRNVAAPCHASAALPTGGWLEPLIDTRARAIVRRGAPPLSIDWDGSIKMVGKGERSRSSR
jgi:hypothetical protein